MSDACFRTDELEVIAALPRDDRRLLHLEDCPRCRALLSTYREFVEPATIPDVADVADVAAANARLSAALRQEIGGGDSDTRVARFLGVLLRPAWRPALVIAGVLIVLLLVPDRSGLRDDGDSITTRRIGVDETASLELRPVEILSDGRIRLSWGGSSEAEAYRVVIYSMSLEEMARFDAETAREIVFEPAEVLDPWRIGEPLLWRVVGFRGGDEVVRSRPHSITLPPH